MAWSPKETAQIIHGKLLRREMWHRFDSLRKFDRYCIWLDLYHSWEAVEMELINSGLSPALVEQELPRFAQYVRLVVRYETCQEVKAALQEKIGDQLRE